MESHTQKTVAIHQPGYLPWLGYIHKILYSDLFIVHDQVEYSKRVFISKVLIRKPESSSESIYLTVPLKKHSDFIQIKNLVVDKSQNWQVKHLNLIRASYQKSPYFKTYFPSIEETILKTKTLDSFVETTNIILKDCLKLFGYEKNIELSSHLPVTGKKNSYNVNLVKHFGGTTYLSGTGAKNYQSSEEFSRDGITIIYQDIFNFLEKKPYYTFYGTFINGLSFIDALFNIGIEGIKKIFESYESDMIEKMKKI